MNRAVLSRGLTYVVTVGALLAFAAPVRAANLSEEFDDVGTLPGEGWTQVNASQPVGTTGWFQGTTTTFVAHSGVDASYIAANFNNTGTLGTINNWLITPLLTDLSNGDTWSFWTRKAGGGFDYVDRLEVRLSKNGSCEPGPGPHGVGDFKTVLMTVNPLLLQGVYATSWTHYSATLSGMVGAQSGCLAFRYYVPNGGLSGDNSDYIGIDTFSYTDVGADAIPPNVFIQIGPSGPTTDTMPGFGFGANEPVSFECRLISHGAPTPDFDDCSGPGHTHTPAEPLADGAYTFEIRGTDAGGNPATAERSFTVITCGPAQEALAKAQAKLSAGKTKLKQARKKLRKARKAGSAAKIKRAKGKVKKAKGAVKAAKEAEATAKTGVDFACAP